jgi:TorA maturation chaperone TorD
VSLEQLSRLRQGVYRLLGAGFSYPTTETVEAAGGAIAVLEELGLFDYAFAVDLAEATSSLAAAELTELEVAFVALFEAGVAGAACPPHESAYRSNARTGEVAGLRSELKRTILRFGLDLDDDSQDMVDHVATEMFVMAMLCRRESELHASTRPFGRVMSSQSEFLNDHILLWVPQFAGMVQARRPNPTYEALAAAIRSFLIHENQIVPLLKAEAEVVS